MNRKNYLGLIGLTVLTLLFITGCASTKSSVEIPPGVDGEKLLWSSEPKRPAWTFEEPVTANGVMSFVGLSAPYATEALARDDAQRNAISRVVSYTGTLAQNKFERKRVDFGLSSQVIDPTTSAREFESHISVAIARQVKAKKWYIEKWQKTTGVGHLGVVNK